MDTTDLKEKKQYEKMIMTPVGPLVFSLAIPGIVSMMTGMIYNLADAFFVGKLGTSASASIGIVMGVQAIFQALGFMLGHGAGSVISMKLAEGKQKEASTFLSDSFFISIIVSAILTVSGLVFTDPLMRLMGSTETILPYARIYGFFILIAGPAFASSCVLNNVLRYEGRAFYAMIGLVAGGVLNMIGDPVLMFGLDMGIWGAGLSTAVSQYISLGILFYMLMSGKTISTISFRYFSHRSRDLVHIVHNGSPSLIRQGLSSISTMVLNNCAMPYGDAAIAAMTIAGRIMQFLASASMGIGQGLQPVAGFNYGAGKYKRLRDAHRFTVVFGEVVMCVLAFSGIAFSSQLVRIFRDDPEVIALGTPAVRFLCLAILTQPFSVSSQMMLQSIGKSGKAAFLSSLRSGLLYIPLLLILPRFTGFLGIQSAQFFSDLLSLVLTIPIMIRFYRKIPGEDRLGPLDELYGR